MPVNNQHPQHRNMVNLWERCIAVAKGQDAVHAAGELFLPKLSNQESADYEKYKKRALFYNATWRTIVGLQGMIFRKPPTVVLPGTVEDMKKDIDMSGTSLHMLCLKLVEEALKLGRVGLFVDYPDVPADATQADGADKNWRPMLKMYGALSIRNWKTSVYKSATILSMVVLEEIVSVPKDEFTDEDQVQFRVLDLVPNNEVDSVGNLLHPGKLMYRVRVMVVEQDDKGKDVDKVISTSYPKIRGKHIEKLPFHFIGVDNTSWDISEPPLIDLVDTNLAHYRVTADYEHGCHFTGLPTPVISGVTDEDLADGAFNIGSTTAWTFRRHEATAHYLEFTGQGLNVLKENLEGKENKMAVMGARMLEAQPSGVESANTAAIHRGGEQSMLASVAQSVSIGVTAAMVEFCEYAEEDSKDVLVELNRDFFPIPMDSLTMTAVIAAWQNGAISYETMFENLKRGEIIPMDGDAEEEQKRIKENPPPAQDVPTTPGDRAGNGPNQGASKGVVTKKGATSNNPTQTQLQNAGK